MSKELTYYECRSCGHSFGANVFVGDGAKCLQCKSIGVFPKRKSNGIREEKIEHKDVLEVLSKFLAEELIEALRLKEDVQIVTTSDDTHSLSMDLLKVKKHVLVINNCNPQLVEHRRRMMEADMIRFAGGCSD
ncbi:hypothetical protein [Bacillus mycoides]|uniref:hypothetical protein n=1 Tax=Bacillus mycoides TaxID=1405 RepID=UPI001F481F12|nr:hypothetical protein [Bacillus mycoides]